MRAGAERGLGAGATTRLIRPDVPDDLNVRPCGRPRLGAGVPVVNNRETREGSIPRDGVVSTAPPGPYRPGEIPASSVIGSAPVTGETSGAKSMPTGGLFT
ncbi:hypothetical protein Cme02nite_11730 [Catellatospora methionotrophica]|uniref:Uncharacterized protein n=1 Tax=Catellatospora methionotrophica TaxID=121620 RepID=A0A8J3PCW1_9ACTN|nr:hypothetical protein Cme02nite_11730 [Catellatospora methionotrophica]